MSPASDLYCENFVRVKEAVDLSFIELIGRTPKEGNLVKQLSGRKLSPEELLNIVIEGVAETLGVLPYISEIRKVKTTKELYQQFCQLVNEVPETNIDSREYHDGQIDF